MINITSDISNVRLWGTDLFVEALRVEDDDHPEPVATVRERFARWITAASQGEKLKTVRLPGRDGAYVIFAAARGIIVREWGVGHMADAPALIFWSGAHPRAIAAGRPSHREIGGIRWRFREKSVGRAGPARGPIAETRWSPW
jgi:hypothetical protein